MSPEADNISQENLLIGIHAVASALGTGAERVVRAWVTRDARNPRVKELEKQARKAGIPVETVPRATLDDMAGGTRHQDIIASLEGTTLLGERDLDRVLESVEGDPLVLVLDEIQDPHNLGACLRTAEAAGVHLVVITKDRSAGLTPVVRRSAAGAAEVIPVLVATNLARVLRHLKDRGIWLTGAAGEGATELWDADLSGPTALVVGGEGEGLRRLTRDLCDLLVRVPMAGTVESLNVSVATGVCLFEIIRTRTAKIRASQS